MTIEGKRTNWENGPIGPGFLIMFAPLASRVLVQRRRRKKVESEPLPKKKTLVRQREDEMLGLLLLLHARE